MLHFTFTLASFSNANLSWASSQCIWTNCCTSQRQTYSLWDARHQCWFSWRCHCLDLCLKSMVEHSGQHSFLLLRANHFKVDLQNLAASSYYIHAWYRHASHACPWIRHLSSYLSSCGDQSHVHVNGNCLSILALNQEKLEDRTCQISSRFRIAHKVCCRGIQ